MTKNAYHESKALDKDVNENMLTPFGSSSVKSIFLGVELLHNVVVKLNVHV